MGTSAEIHNKIRMRVLHLPFILHASGPPESPPQASIPPSNVPAQIILSRILCRLFDPYTCVCLHVFKSRSGTEAACRIPEMLLEPSGQRSFVSFLVSGGWKRSKTYVSVCPSLKQYTNRQHPSSVYLFRVDISIVRANYTRSFHLS